MDLDEYLARFERLAAHWDALRAFEPERAEKLVTDALAHGVERTSQDLATQLPAPSQETILQWQTALIDASGLFDAPGYREANNSVPRVRSGKSSPVEHFLTKGWSWLFNPRADFDLWWYWNEYLDPARLDLNPFVYYLLEGRRAGHATRPTAVPVRPDAPTAGADVRRICLYAGYDLHGIVDDYVVAYLGELSRYADVYYLADGTMSEAELAKLDHVTKGAWAIPHGRYDFGSFCLLARDLVGWETIDRYDELVLANDSCFLLRPLDQVFERMDPRPADWWGMHATKRDFERARGDDHAIPLAQAKRLHTAAEDWNMLYRLHLSSFFLVYRKRVISDPGFRRRLSEVVEQPDKGIIIRKYEIGLSDYLIKSGFGYDTYLDALHPYLPVYTEDYFSLLDEGFPLLKRNLITDNPRLIPDLAHWRERILAKMPSAPVDLIEKNIERVAAQDRLARSLAVRTAPDGTVEDPYAELSPRFFRELDASTPTYDHWWAFPVCAFDHTLAGNERAVFEEVREDPSIKKIVLTRSKAVDVQGQNVVVAPINSPEGAAYLARAKQIFVKHGPVVNVPWPVDSLRHNVINLWHGIPLKRFGTAMLSYDPEEHDGTVQNNTRSRAVIASSRIDALAINAAFFPVSYPDVWVTGLPRNDFVTRPDELLPEDLRAAADRLRAEVGDRRLVLFLPTFKDGQADAYYHFDESEIDRLKAWAQRHHAVIGVREHMADAARTYSKALAPVGIIDVSSRRYPDLEVLYRVADALVSDYSSCLVDFMLTGRPVISFAYDYEHYVHQERGLFYQLDQVLPGPVCRDFDALATALEDVFEPPTAAAREAYEWRRRTFFDEIDDQASWRVVQKVKSTYTS